MCHGNTFHCWMYIMSTNINRVYQKEFSQPYSKGLDFWSHQSHSSWSSGIQAPGKSWILGIGFPGTFHFPSTFSQKMTEHDKKFPRKWHKITENDSKWRKCLQTWRKKTGNDGNFRVFQAQLISSQELSTFPGVTDTFSLCIKDPFPGAWLGLQPVCYTFADHDDPWWWL